MMRCVVASDHGAIELKQGIVDYLSSIGTVSVQDLGVHTQDSVDYPDIANLVVQAILTEKADIGILCCGTGIGISMRANRSKGIRAALVYSEFTAQMAKAHNNANVLCLGGRTTTRQDAITYVQTWLDTQYEAGRHDARLLKLDQ